MGILVSVIVGIALTLPISSAAICAALGLTGLAGGAAVAGCCAQMVGFAVLSFRENRWGGLVSQGLGTSMLQMGNIVRNPRIWIPPTLASAITGPIATCLFRLEMNGTPVSSGMGTCGLVGAHRGLHRLGGGHRLAMYLHWGNGLAGLGPASASYVLPGVLTWLLGIPCRKAGWIKEGDLKLED
ncbi:MAG: PTS sugar transporter subunit IIC [Evtepia gabavorous]